MQFSSSIEWIHKRTMMPLKLKQIRTLAFAAIALPFTALADPIEIVPLNGGTDGGSVGGYLTDPFANTGTTDPTSPGDDIYCVASPINGDLCFEDKYGNPEGMDASDPQWWEWDGTPDPDHQNIYTSDISWIEIILPENTRAFSFWVGASFSGNAWFEAFNEDGYTTGRNYFGVDEIAHRVMAFTQPINAQQLLA